MTQLVASDKVVFMHYTLRNAEGEELDSSRGADPLPYLHGHGNIVPGLEQALEGAAVGSSHEVVVAPEDGYGERMPGPPQEVPREAFPAELNVQAGMQFMTQTEDGHVLPIWAVDANEEIVFVELNHPLAGVELHFEVEIMDIRDASPEEVEHGHAHGPGGHHH